MEGLMENDVRKASQDINILYSLVKKQIKGEREKGLPTHKFLPKIDKSNSW